MLRRAATDAGIAAVTFEIGSPLRLEPTEIEKGVHAIEALMQRLKMLPRRRGLRQDPPPVYYGSRWVRSPAGGMLMAEVSLGERVRKGQRLGLVIDPLRDRSVAIEAPVSGRIIGMAQNQLVLPGFAAFHIGIGGSEEALLEAVGTGKQEVAPEHDRLDPALGDPREPEAVPEDEEMSEEAGVAEADRGRAPTRTGHGDGASSICTTPFAARGFASAKPPLPAALTKASSRTRAAWFDTHRGLPSRGLDK